MNPSQRTLRRRSTRNAMRRLRTAAEHSTTWTVVTTNDLRYLLDRAQTLGTALRPLGALVDHVPAYWSDDCNYMTGIIGDTRANYSQFTAGDVRRAAAALRGDDDE